MRDSEALFRAAFSRSAIGVALVSWMRWLQVNVRYAAFLAIRIGTSRDHVSDGDAPEDLMRIASY